LPQRRCPKIDYPILATLLLAGPLGGRHSAREGYLVTIASLLGDKRFYAVGGRILQSPPSIACRLAATPYTLPGYIERKSDK